LARLLDYFVHGTVSAARAAKFSREMWDRWQRDEALIRKHEPIKSKREEDEAFEG
jgi:hypothetical protein